MRLLVDANLSPKVADGLRTAGFGAIAALVQAIDDGRVQAEGGVGESCRRRRSRVGTKRGGRFVRWARR